jgi:hypothetical protein
MTMVTDPVFWAGWSVPVFSDEASRVAGGACVWVVP